MMRKLQVTKMSEEQKIILSNTAQNDFSNGNYSASLQSLGQLMLQKPADPKVVHNKAVVEFYSSGHKNLETFQKSLNYLCNMNRININETDSPEDVEFCVIYFNQAIIYYLQKQYDVALKVMEKIFGLVQPMDEHLAHKVCLLHLELHICLNQPEKTLHVLNQIETQFISLSNHGSPSKSEKDKGAKNAAGEASIDDLRIKLLHYKAKCHILNKELELAKKDLDTIYAAKKQNYSSILMRSHIEFLKNNYEKAGDILTVIQEDIDNFCVLGEQRKFVYYNNIGCLYHYMGKPAMAKYYLCNKGFLVCVNALEKFYNKPVQNVTVERSDVFKPVSIARFKYNAGVALLFAGKPNAAFEFFTEASQLMHTTPLVWLRLAECCILVHTSGNEALFDFKGRRRELVSGAVGNGPTKKILLNNKIYQDNCYSSEPQSYAIPTPNLDFATLCMRNARRLVTRGSSKLKLAIYAASAYINLTIGNPVEALRDASFILEEKTASDLYKYLARMYKAEALIFLDRIPEAIELLNPSTYKDCDPSQEKLLSDWCPKNKFSAHTALQYNLAVAFAIRGDLEKSAELLKRIWVSRGSKSDVPIHVISLALYIELVLGHVDIARTIIKQNCPHIFS